MPKLPPLPDFVSGRELARGFFVDEVQPRLRGLFDKTPYAAGLLGSGSEVLGFDTERSTDHHWGPKVVILTETKNDELWNEASGELSRSLPPTYRGWSTHWAPADEIGVRLLTAAQEGQPIAHRVEFEAIENFLVTTTGWNGRTNPTLEQWLTTPEQQWRALAAGSVFHDEVGYDSIRTQASFYPDEVLRYLMASQWKAIAQELPFVWRCAEVGDELGSRLVATRLVQAAMRIGFWLCQEFPPYSKWWGTAFSKLRLAPELQTFLLRVTQSDDETLRLDAINRVLGRLIVESNRLGWLRDLDPTPVDFHGRPGKIAPAEQAASLLAADLTDERLKTLPLIGSLDVWTSSTDVLTNRRLQSSLSTVYNSYFPKTP